MLIQINVAQQLKAPTGSVRNYQVNETTCIADGNSLLQGEVSLMRTDRSILVKGTLHTEVELSCSRCLALFSYSLTLNIEAEYFPTTDIVTGASLPPPDEVDYFTIDENNILDLSETIRQYALLATPMKPLCRQDCAGLCPTCGCNLNQVHCNCPSTSADPRFAKLVNLALISNDTSLNEQKGTK